jgi:hypothetical protein
MSGGGFSEHRAAAYGGAGAPPPKPMRLTPTAMAAFTGTDETLPSSSGRISNASDTSGLPPDYLGATPFTEFASRTNSASSSASDATGPIQLQDFLSTGTATDSLELLGKGFTVHQNRFIQYFVRERP